MYLIDIPEKDLSRMASKADLLPGDIIRKARRILQILNSDLQEFGFNVIKNTHQEWIYEVLLNGSRIENGKFQRGGILSMVKCNDEQVLGKILANMLENCDVHHSLRSEDIEEMDIYHLVREDSFMGFARNTFPRFPNLKSLRMNKLELDFHQERFLKVRNGMDAASLCNGSLTIFLGDKHSNEFLRKLFSFNAFELVLTGKITHDPDDIFVDMTDNYRGILTLPEITHIRTEKLARILCRKKNKIICEKGVQISDVAAETFATLGIKLVAPILEMESKSIQQNLMQPAHVLMKRGCPLDLDDLTSVPRCLWKIISMHNNAISLNGLQTIEDDFALKLSRHKYPLYLKNVKHISEKALNALKFHKKVHLPGFGLSSTELENLPF